MKKITIALIVACAVVVAVFGGAVAVGCFGLDYNWGAEFEALEKHVDAQLMENGDLVIEENIRYKFNRWGRVYYNPRQEYRKTDVPGIRSGTRP